MDEDHRAADAVKTLKKVKCPSLQSCKTQKTAQQRASKASLICIVVVEFPEDAHLRDTDCSVGCESSPNRHHPIFIKTYATSPS